MFDDLLAAQDAALMVDDAGLVMAGAYWAPDGRDLAQEISAALSGVSDEAERAARHLSLGPWRAIVFETEAAIVALAPVKSRDEAALLVVVTAAVTPLGALMRTQSRCIRRATEWLGGAHS